jgi:hypothetical protein
MSSNKLKREFSDLVKNNKIHRFVTHLQYCKDPTEIKKIKDILSTLQLVSASTTVDEESKLKEYLKTIDAYQYRKQWNRLKPFQRENRLINFMDDQKIPTPVREELLELHEKGDLRFSRDVKYDHLKGNLLGIFRLEKTKSGEFIVVEASKKNLKSDLLNEDDDEDEDEELKEEVSKSKSSKKLSKTFNKVKKNKTTSSDSNKSTSSDSNKSTKKKSIKKITKSKK